MTDRTRGREFAHSLQRFTSDARGTEQARASGAPLALGGEGAPDIRAFGNNFAGADA